MSSEQENVWIKNENKICHCSCVTFSLFLVWECIHWMSYGSYGRSQKLSYFACTSIDARNKYISSYIEGNIGRVSWRPAMERLQLPIEHTSNDTGPLSPTLASSLPSQPLSAEENTILGYMPHRDDFERVNMGRANCHILYICLIWFRMRMLPYFLL